MCLACCAHHLQAIEAEADSKQGMQDTYDDCLDPNSDSSSTASSFAMLDGDSRYALCLQDTVAHSTLWHCMLACSSSWFAPLCFVGVADVGVAQCT